MKMFILYLILDIIMIYTMVLCIEKISKKTVTKKLKFIICSVVLASLIVINNMYCFNELKIINSLLLTTIYIKYIFSLTLKDAITYTLIYFVLEIIVELFLSLTLPLISIENVSELNRIYIIKILFSLIECIIILLLFNNRKIAQIITKTKTIIKEKFVNTKIIGIIAIILNILSIFLSKKLNDANLILYSFSSILFIIVFGLEIINYKYNIFLLKQSNENLNSSINAYSEIVDSYKEFKHNLKNDLIALKTNLPEIQQESINNIINKYNKNYEWISNLSNVPKGLQGLIYIKEKEAKKHNIKLYCEIKSNIKIKNEDYFIISDIVGILLDNAIEASILCKGNSIVVNITENKNTILIEVINQFTNILDLNKITEKNYSTKKKKSGIGLNYINKIKKPYIKVEYNIINDLFYAKVKYKKNRDK